MLLKVVTTGLPNSMITIVGMAHSHDRGKPLAISSLTGRVVHFDALGIGAA